MGWLSSLTETLVSSGEMDMASSELDISPDSTSLVALTGVSSEDLGFLLAGSGEGDSPVDGGSTEVGLERLRPTAPVLESSSGLAGSMALMLLERRKVEPSGGLRMIMAFLSIRRVGRALNAIG